MPESDLSQSAEKPRLLYMVTHSMAARWLLRGQLAYMRENGFDVSLITAPSEHSDVVRDREGIAVYGVEMEREISPLRDIRGLWGVYRQIRKIKPHIINAGTAKAALFGMTAARAAGVPIRIYMQRGIRLETTRGMKRSVLRMTERITSACAHRIVGISESVRQAHVNYGLAPAHKTGTMHKGSSNGIDVDRYRVTPEKREAAARLRQELGIPAEAPVIGFVGRMTRDKGIIDLADAFESVLKQEPSAWLLLVGNFEEGDPVPEDCMRRLLEHPRVTTTGFVPETSIYYPLMDMLAFPTYREGFGNVAVEAAAAELPVVGFRVTGVVDSVADGVTGTLVEAGDRRALAAALQRYLEDPQLRRAHGRAGFERADRDFRGEPLWQAWHEEYCRLLDARGLPLPTMRPGAQMATDACESHSAENSPDSRPAVTR